MAEDRNKNELKEMEKGNGLYRLSKLLGAGGMVLVLFGCLLFIIICAFIAGYKG